jgi:hypothetical protein
MPSLLRKELFAKASDRTDLRARTRHHDVERAVGAQTVVDHDLRSRFDAALG